MPTFIESAARADHTKGAAIWARPATAPALTIVRRFTAPQPRRLVICSSLKGFFGSVILPVWLEFDKGLRASRLIRAEIGKHQTIGQAIERPLMALSFAGPGKP